MNLPDELLAAIAANPDDPAARAVAADWLQERGDPHGELIALALANAEPARVAELELALIPHDWTWGWTRGWRGGFLERLACGDVVAETLRGIPEALAQPAARLLRVLAIEGSFISVFVRGLLERALAGSPELRVLVVWSTSGWKPSLAIDGARFPHLTSLAMTAVALPAPLVLPELDELALSLDEVAGFAGSALPRLRTLRLTLPSGAGVAELDAVLARVHVPALQHLALAVPRPDGALANLAPGARLTTFELIDTASDDRDRRRFVRDRGARSERAVLLDLVGGALVELPTALDGVRIEWTGADWWLRGRAVAVNHLSLDHVRLIDGDELRLSGARTYRFVNGDDLEPRLAAWRTRYGLQHEA